MATIQDRVRYPIVDWQRELIMGVWGYLDELESKWNYGHYDTDTDPRNRMPKLRELIHELLRFLPEARLDGKLVLPGTQRVRYVSGTPKRPLSEVIRDAEYLFDDRNHQILRLRFRLDPGLRND